MTTDVVALCRQQPDLRAAISALLAAGPQLHVRAVQRGGLVELCDDAGRILVTVEGPLLVQVPTEANRLLDPAIAAPHPVWWVEARSARRDGEEPAIARRLAEALVANTGGCVWPSG